MKLTLLILLNKIYYKKDYFVNRSQLNKKLN